MQLKRLFAVVFALVTSYQNLPADVTADLNALTGSLPTRIVWLEGGDKLMGGGRLMGFDTRTGAATQILAAAENQNRPILCTGGNRVVVSIDYRVYVVNWDGADRRLIADGICSSVWMDPATGLEWAVVRAGRDTNDGSVRRYLIEDPTRSFMLWDKTGAGDFYLHWYQISADGTVAFDFLPWNQCFIVDDGGLAANGPETRLSDGCWSSLASDNSYVSIHFPGSSGHSAFGIWRYKTHVADYTIQGVPLPAGTSTREFYHPKFASHGGRFVLITGGYTESSNSDAAEIYMGRFNEGYTAVEQWVRITSNATRDYYPDAWVGVAPPSPTLRFSSDSLGFSMQQGGANPAAQTVTVTTPFGTFSGMSAGSGASWLAAGTPAGSGAHYTIANTVNGAGLASGVYNTQVTVTAPDAAPPVRTYRVKLTVRGTPAADSVIVTPAVSTVVKTKSVQLTATMLDQHEQPLAPQPAFAWSVTPAGAAVNAGLFTAGGTAGLYTVTATSGALSASALVNVVDFIPVHLSINCGDPTPGYVPGWSGDERYLVPGYEGQAWADIKTSPAFDLSGVANPPPRAVYDRFRSGDLRYSFPDVPEGSYRLRFHFIEIYSGNSVGQRDITISAENTQLIAGLNLLAEAGALYKAFVKEYTVTVNGDGLQITFGGSYAMLNGFEIISSGSLAKRITLLEPLGGEQLRVGDLMTVRWTAASDIIGVVIQISADDGPWNRIVTNTILNTDPDWGTFRWVILPAIGNNVSMVSNDVRVRVAYYQDEAVNDYSSPIRVLASDAVVRRPGLVPGSDFNWRVNGRTLLFVNRSAKRLTIRLFDVTGRTAAQMHLDKPGMAELGRALPRGKYLLQVESGGKKSAGVPVCF